MFPETECKAFIESQLETRYALSMNWIACNAVEIVPGKVSGAPVVKGTRLPAQTVVDNFNAGVSAPDIADMFDVPLADIRTVIEFAKENRVPSPV